MPELPEVETVLRGLKENITGETVKTVFCSSSRIFRTDQSGISELLPGLPVTQVERRGKYLVLYFSTHRLVVHLGMTGSLVVKNENGPHFGRHSTGPAERHIHMILSFRSGRVLLYRDPRMFGRILLFYEEKDLSDYFNRLGIEPLSAGFTLTAFKRILARRKGQVKPFLMNQSHVCGLGNIYADEALFESGIHPETPVSSLEPADIRRLYHAIPRVLEEGIRFGGTTFRDYRNSAGKEGGFQEMLNVYGREGLECRKCRSLVRKIQVGGRSSHFCPHCQKKPRELRIDRLL